MDTRVEQILSNGLVIRQDIRTSIRFVMFQTELPEWEYATDGGTLFLVNHRNRIFGLTCLHVFKTFNVKDLIATDRKMAQKSAAIAGISGLMKLGMPSGAAVESDILDICLIEFATDVDASFFIDPPYIIDEKTVATSQKGDCLLVAGTLKERASINEPYIDPGFCALQYVDDGPFAPDIVLRRAVAEFQNPEFTSVAGLSGSPVFNYDRRGLAGVAVRAGITGNKSTLHYVDAYDIYRVLDGVYRGIPRTDYTKLMVIS